jgi:2-polyprenyl-3-methyl-5-hydroxy-6-metoxy-1,4-benzoquinol methylase
MGDLAGKSVLDVGCGDGLNALNFAMLGASSLGKAGRSDNVRRADESQSCAEKAAYVIANQDRRDA